jgi:hypothetical protein
MMHMPAMRVFTLRPEGVRCGADGLFVDSVPLLRRARDPYGREHWSLRSASELDSELTERYGLPIDVTTKAGGFASIARSLDRGDLALAEIGALLLQFPDPPPLGKSARAAEVWVRLAVDLACSGLLKSDWDPAKHPRTGEKPNAGWFAEIAREAQEVTARMRTWPSQEFNKALRDSLKKISAKGWLSDFGPYGDAAAIVWEIVEDLGPSALNDGEDRAIQQTNAYFDPPKTLEELQRPPTENLLGYETHHEVEQNDANVAKAGVSKFGREAIDDPSNTVYIPRLKHELISADYSRKDDDDPLGRTLREVADELDFDRQRAIGIKMLRKYGILK